MARHVISRPWGLVARACELRKPMTPAQAAVWRELKGRKLLGCRFERQHAIERYVVDFYCSDLGLAVEVESLNRDDPADCQYARERDVRLRLRGVAVLRFTDEEVLYNLDGVVSKIRQCVRYLPSRKAGW